MEKFKINVVQKMQKKNKKLSGEISIAKFDHLMMGLSSLVFL